MRNKRVRDDKGLPTSRPPTLSEVPEDRPQFDCHLPVQCLCLARAPWDSPGQASLSKLQRYRPEGCPLTSVIRARCTNPLEAKTLKSSSNQIREYPRFSM